MRNTIMCANPKNRLEAGRIVKPRLFSHSCKNSMPAQQTDILTVITKSSINPNVQFPFPFLIDWVLSQSVLQVPNPFYPSASINRLFFFFFFKANDYSCNFLTDSAFSEFASEFLTTWLPSFFRDLCYGTVTSLGYEIPFPENRLF